MKNSVYAGEVEVRVLYLESDYGCEFDICDRKRERVHCFLGDQSWLLCLCRMQIR